MKMVRYNIDFYQNCTKKWGKIVLSITPKGVLQLSLTPTFTPGIEPEDLKDLRNVPKKYKLYNYNEEVIINLGFSDVLKLIKWFSNQKNILDIVELYRNARGVNKKIVFNYYSTDNKTISTCTIFVTYKESSKNKNISFKLPLSISSMEEIISALKSYLNNYAIIQLVANAKTIYEDSDIDIISDITYNSVLEIFKKAKLPNSDKLQIKEINNIVKNNFKYENENIIINNEEEDE